MKREERKREGWLQDNTHTSVFPDPICSAPATVVEIRTRDREGKVVYSEKVRSFVFASRLKSKRVSRV